MNACAGEGKSDYQKALALHDWLCENASYDDTLTIHDPSGVLLQGTGVCESFALAYQMLLTEAGVENVYVTGTANGGGHAWNMVKLDGEWYHVDVTWDENSTDRYYFGMSTALISRDHAIEDRVPTATATKYNYAMNASDGAFASLNELGGLFEKLPAAQEDFIFYYTGSDDIGAAYREWVLANAGTYGITSYSYMTGSYTRYVSGTKEAQEAYLGALYLAVPEEEFKSRAEFEGLPADAVWAFALDAKKVIPERYYVPPEQMKKEYGRDNV